MRSEVKMKQILTHIVQYKLTPKDFDSFLDELLRLTEQNLEQKNIHHIDELQRWIHELSLRKNKQPFSSEEQEVIFSILHQIEKLLVHEMVFQ
jgi:hypothetical protein